MDEQQPKILHRVFYVTGSKGGVGKSLVAKTLAHCINEQNQRLRIIDTDDSNPDVDKVYGKFYPSDFIPLNDNAKSWTDFINRLETITRTGNHHQQRINVVVNGAARDNKSIEHYGDLLNDTCNEGLNYRFITVWVLNNLQDSVKLLETYLKTVTIGTVFAMRNEHFAPSAEFFEFNRVYPLMKRISSVYDFPVLETSVLTYIDRNNLTFSDVTGMLQVGTRMLLKRWLRDVSIIFSGMFNILDRLDISDGVDKVVGNSIEP
ncbi:hypothetical protein FACS1894187_14890 [Synergistales bacterium]|nr:hypothetical protein FACS1894187_14890 [Synergistales bacterium]